MGAISSDRPPLDASTSSSTKKDEGVKGSSAKENAVTTSTATIDEQQAAEVALSGKDVMSNEPTPEKDTSTLAPLSQSQRGQPQINSTGQTH